MVNQRPGAGLISWTGEPRAIAPKEVSGLRIEITYCLE